jgi:hypothetical protein
MNADQVFSAVFLASNALVLPFWALMIFAPRAEITRRAVGSLAVCLPFALLYLALFAEQAGSIASAAVRPSLSQVAALMGAPRGACLAWAHYLTCDLFLGRWIYLDAQERNVAPLVMAPVLLLGLTFAPLGLLAYWVVTVTARRRTALAGAAR